MAKQTIKIVRKTKKKYRKSKANSQNCPTCGKFYKKKKK